MIFRGRDRTQEIHETFGVVDCLRCGFRFTHPRPSPAAMATFYPETYGPYQRGALSGSEIFNPGVSRVGQLKNRLKWISLVRRYGYVHLAPPAAADDPQQWPRWLCGLAEAFCGRYLKMYYPRLPVWRERGRALDVGCGNGAYLLLLKRLGWNATGFDLSDRTQPEVKAEGIPIFTGSLKRFKHLEGTFDLVSLWHVLEHVHAPLEMLATAHRLLSAGGILMLEVPDCRSLAARLFGRHWFGYDLPRHLSHFSMTTVRRMVAAADFQILQAGHVWKQHIPVSLDLVGQGRRWSRFQRLAHDSTGIRRFFNYLGGILALVGVGEVIYLKARKRGT